MGLHAEISTREVILEDGGRQKQTCNFGPSALFGSVNNNFSVAAGSSLQLVTPNKIVCLYYRDYLHTNSPPFLSGLSLVLGTS